MKFLLRSFKPTPRFTPLKCHLTLLTSTHISHLPIQPITLTQYPRPLYHFATSKQQQPPNDQPSPNSTTKDFKLTQLKSIFQTHINKYNLKAILNIYQTLTSHQVPLSPASLTQFRHRLLLQLNNIDHPSLNTLLSISLRTSQTYHPKSNNQLLRGINLKLLKSRLPLNPQHAHKTLQLLIKMNFPKPTVSKFIFNLVKENEAQKRLISMMSNLNGLKVALVSVQLLEVDLQIKKRVLQNMLRIKPKGVVQMAYFYSVISSALNKLDESVIYQAQKRTVYDLAFNPYSRYEQKQQTQQHQPTTQTNQQNTSLTKKHQTNQQNTSLTSKQDETSINPTIMQQLTKQKESIIEETLNRLDVRQIQGELYERLSLAMKGEAEEELKWTDLKRICLLLIDNSFGVQGKANRDMLTNMTQRVLDESLSDSDASTSNLSKVIRLPQFIILVQQLSTSPKTLHYFATYHNTYYPLMNLEEKLMFTYHQSKLHNTPIDLMQVHRLITQIQYGLNPDQFGWLNKLLSHNQPTHSSDDKQLVKDIWRMLETNLDLQLDLLQKQKIEKELRQTQQRNAQNQQQQKGKEKPSTHENKSNEQIKK